MIDPGRTNMRKVGRLAMRAEGRWWCAYYAEPDSMDKAIRLAKIHMSVVEDALRREAFMHIMGSFVAELIEKATGQRPDLHIEDAPAGERKQ